MTNNVDTSAISEEAGRIAASTPNINDLLANRLDELELLIADLGQISEFTTKSVKFMEEAATEIRWNRRARLGTLLVVLGIIFGLAIMLWLIMGGETFRTLRENPVSFSTALAATIGGGVILATSVSRSVFSNFSERNGGMPMPEHLKTIWDGISSFLPSR